jgi:hypothetical protein
MTVLNSPYSKLVPSVDQVTQTTIRSVRSAINNLQQCVINITPTILKAQQQQALLKAKREKPLIKSDEFKPVEVKLFEANTKQFEFDINTYNVTSKADLERLSERLFEEHQRATRSNRKENAALLERTINVIEMQNTVPETAYRPLAAMGIRLVKPEEG